MAALQDMTDLLMFTIVVLTVSGQHPMHDAPDCVRLALNQQVHVIGHQTVGVEKEGQLLLLILEQRQKLLIIGRVVEDSLSIIAARDYVIEATFQLQAWESRHRARILFPSGQIVNSQSRVALRTNRRIAGLTLLFVHGEGEELF